MKSDYYKGAKRVMKSGIPCRVAPWYSELTTNGRAMMMQGNNLCKKPSRRPIPMKTVTP